MKKYYLLLSLLLALAIFQPAAAGNYTSLEVWSVNGETISFSDINTIEFDAAEKHSAIAEVTLSGIQPGTIDLKFHQLNGNVIPGQILYTRSGVLDSTGEYTLALGNESKSWSGLENYLDKIFLAAYVKDLDSNEIGLLITDVWIGNTVSGYANSVFSSVPDLGNFPVTKIEITSSDKIRVDIKYAEFGEVQKEIKDEDFNVLSWMGRLFEFVANAGGILFQIIAIFKFLFIDHFLSIIVLYESVCMAYAAANSRDIFSFCKKLIRYNKALFEAIIGFINVIISIFHKIIDAIKIF
ncbi:hypothetical protein F1737_04390 [Methanoplanus sp. FWC-SCC4]|uniref:Uncharacterized protein n=1 Tax=Methanochimaera problematica TaxID=2609417 RepID=A0AA97FD23_9EURY|nr:hypothetical protein [Methanoplanus sp. FWC-SCC4]WOF15994.1 hypothetical protein F1737_04390 [Methanoplanus sp. FWC-SCC4]